MRYVLDTNTCIYALKLQGRVVERMREHLPSEIVITTITLADRASNALEIEAASTYARVRFDLERIGRPIGERDLLIASVALARNLTVVTHNLGEFTRVPALKTEDWH